MKNYLFAALLLGATITPGASYKPGGTDVAVADGGTGQSTAAAAYDALAPTTTRGDLIYRDATTNARLAKGSSGDVLTQGANDPAWAAQSTINAGQVDGLEGASFQQTGTYTQYAIVQWGNNGTSTTAAGVNGFMAVLSASAVDYRMGKWTVPADYASGQITVVPLMRMGTDTDDLAFVYAHNVYKLGVADSAAVIPAATYASGNITKTLDAGYAQGDFIDVGYTTTGFTLSPGDVLAFEMGRIGDDAADTTANPVQLIGWRISYLANKL